jgi:hypothetical protein
MVLLTWGRTQVEVILNYNRTLLSRLEQRMQNWHSLGQCLGDIFLQVVRTHTGGLLGGISQSPPLSLEKSSLA